MVEKFFVLSISDNQTVIYFIINKFQAEILDRRQLMQEAHLSDLPLVNQISFRVPDQPLREPIDISSVWRVQGGDPDRISQYFPVAP